MRPLVISGRRGGRLVVEPPFHEIIGVSRWLWLEEFRAAAEIEFVARNGEPIVYVEIGFSPADDLVVFARRY